MDYVQLLHDAVNSNSHLPRYWSIYPLENIIAKRARGRREAEREFNIGQFLQEQEIKVPKMVQLYDGRKADIRIPGWFILMERLPGIPLLHLEGAELAHAISQYRSELERVVDLGILPIEFGYAENGLFDKEKDITYLIDFEKWKKGSKIRLWMYRKLVRERLIWTREWVNAYGSRTKKVPIVE